MKIKMEKMPVARQAEIRKNIYSLIVDTLTSNGFVTESFKGEVLVDLGEGYFGNVTFGILDPLEFNIEAVRAFYRKNLDERAEKNAKAATKKRRCD